MFIPFPWPYFDLWLWARGFGFHLNLILHQVFYFCKYFGFFEEMKLRFYLPRHKSGCQPPCRYSSFFSFICSLSFFLNKFSFMDSSMALIDFERMYEGLGDNVMLVGFMV